MDRAVEQHGRVAVSARAQDPRPLIAHACRILDACGQSDMVWGHVSIRDREGRGVWLKGSGLGFEEVTAEDVILLSWDGEILDGTAGRHIEYPIHTEIMRRRDEVNAVVHSHPLHSVAFAATGWPMKHLCHDSQHFVPPEIPRFTRTSDLVETPELGEALADSLGDRVAILMPHHGITTAAGSLGDAVAAAVQLERACEVALLAGPDATGAREEDAIRKHERSPERLAAVWKYLSRTIP
ncbi:MAG TPA: class II aldolase/adducin family protein [Solirubrobacteraceae bacterium]|nr:class II aldolase/adducin family protein [Solirubrobacteraceae bacterium]